MMNFINNCCGPRRPPTDGGNDRKLKHPVPEPTALNKTQLASHMAELNVSHEKPASPPPKQAPVKRIREPKAYEMDDLHKLYKFDFSKSGMLGRGHFAEVFRGESIPQTPDEPIYPVAAKRILRSKTRSSVLKQEISVMLKVRENPGVVTLYDVFYDSRYVLLVLELMEGGELFDRICGDGVYSERDASIHARLIATALRDMHAAGIVHRDLKPENLILQDKSAQSIIKIADFGLSKVIDSDTSVMHTVCGTRAYAAPEVNFGGPPRSGKYTAKVDTWSFGVILYIILGGYHPFDEYGTSKDDSGLLWERVCSGDWSFNDECWDCISPEAKDLITNLIEVDPARRLSAEEILQHPWITGYDVARRVPLQQLSGGRRSLRSFVVATMEDDETMSPPGTSVSREDTTVVTATVVEPNKTDKVDAEGVDASKVAAPRLSDMELV